MGDDDPDRCDCSGGVFLGLMWAAIMWGVVFAISFVVWRVW